MSDWQLIESYPKDGTRFLAFFPDYVTTVIIVHLYDPGGKERNPKHHFETLVDDGGAPLWQAQPTHWMSLPAPPKT